MNEDIRPLLEQLADRPRPKRRPVAEMLTIKEQAKTIYFYWIDEHMTEDKMRELALAALRAAEIFEDQFDEFMENR